MSISLGEAEQCRACSVTVAFYGIYIPRPAAKNLPHPNDRTNPSLMYHLTTVTTITYQK